MDLFAAEIGKDPAEVRRINLIPKFIDSYTTTDRPDLRRAATTRPRSTRRSTQPGYAELRAEQARRRRVGRRQAARHRRQRLRRDHRRCPAGRRQREDRGARRRLGHRLHRHVAARPGPRHRLVDDHHRADRHPDGSHHPRVGRHRPRARGRRHDGIALAPARRLGGQPGRDGARREGDRSSPRRSSKPTRPTSCSTRTPVRSTSPARRPWRRRGPTSPRRRRADDPLTDRHRLQRQRRVVPVRRPRQRRRGRHASPVR